MKYIFNNDLEDKIKEEELWKEGFKYPITAILGLLGVSLSFVKQNMLKDINSVVYAPNFVYKRSNYKTLTYIKYYDLRAWILTHATYEKQTEFVDLGNYLAPYKNIYKEAINLYKSEKNRLNERDRAHKLAKGYVPDKVLNYINNELNIIGAEHNLSNQKRGKVTWHEVERIDILDPKYKIYNLKTTDAKGINRESVYRNIFENGDIKVKLSPQVAIFVHNDINLKNYVMPFLVPYGKSIRVLGRKNSNSKQLGHIKQDV